jgi:hypothetical protein
MRVFVKRQACSKNNNERCKKSPWSFLKITALIFSTRAPAGATRLRQTHKLLFYMKNTKQAREQRPWAKRLLHSKVSAAARWLTA